MGIGNGKQRQLSVQEVGDELISQQPRRIAVISEHASPLADPGSVDSGGQNVYVAQVSRQLARAGFKVDVFTRCDSPDIPDIVLWEDGVRVIHVPAGPAEFVPKEDLLPYMQDFTRFMIQFMLRQKQAYDVIHANFWMSGMVAADIKKELGIPYIVTFHALGRVRRLHQGDQDGFPDERFDIEERVVKEADRVLAECPQDQQDLAYLYQADPSKLVIVPCGFDPVEIRSVNKSVARRRLGLDPEEFIVLQLGRMVPRKGVDNVVRAFAQLAKNASTPVRLIVVGGESSEPDPELTPEIGRLQGIAAEEGISDRVTFTGRRSRAEVSDYYSAADVFVSTPWYEPFGITPVEAMAAGAPVIGARVGGIKYTVLHGETGFLVPPRDPHSLAQRLLYLYENPAELRRMSRAARKRARELFTWQRVGTLINEVIEEVLSSESSRLAVTGARVYDPSSLVAMVGSAANVGNRTPSHVSLPTARQKAALPQQPDLNESFNRNFESAMEVLKRSKERLGLVVIHAANLIINTLARGNKVLVCGNGGSAADAQHFAAEFVGRFMYPERRGLPVLALTADTAFLTAWANDVAYDQVFARQVETFGKAGDLLIGVSTSGRSRNLVEAFQVARQSGIYTLALLGSGGGELLPLADHAILAPTANTQRIQEIHILVMHTLVEMVESQMLASGALLSAVAGQRQSAWNLQSAIPVQLQQTK